MHICATDTAYNGNDFVGKAYEFGRFKLVDIPGYDGQHAVAENYKTKKDSGNKPEGSLTLEQFVDAYKLFESDTNALIFVVNKRITVHDRELMALAVASRKFFCIVCTNADFVARIVDDNKKVARLVEMEEEIRDKLDLTKNLNIKIFTVSIPWPESRINGDELQGADLNHVNENVRVLDVHLITSYLIEPRGLYEELKIHSIVADEVGAALEPYIHVKKWRVFTEFSQHAILGALLPVI